MKHIFAVAGTLVLLAAPPACDSAGTFKQCNTRPRNPTVTLDAFGTPVVDTFTVSYCDTPPAEHHVQVWMEYTTDRADPTSWVPVIGRTGPFRECHEIPTPAGSECHFLADCLVALDGWYRTRVSIVGSGPDGTPFTFSPPEMPDGRIACP